MRASAVVNRPAVPRGGRVERLSGLEPDATGLPRGLVTFAATSQWTNTLLAGEEKGRRRL